MDVYTHVQCVHCMDIGIGTVHVQYKLSLHRRLYNLFPNQNVLTLTSLLQGRGTYTEGSRIQASIKYCCLVQNFGLFNVQHSCVCGIEIIVCVNFICSSQGSIEASSFFVIQSSIVSPVLSEGNRYFRPICENANTCMPQTLEG